MDLIQRSLVVEANQVMRWRWDSREQEEFTEIISSPVDLEREKVCREADGLMEERSMERQLTTLHIC